MAQEQYQDVSFEIIAQTKRSETNVIKLRGAVEQLAQKVASGNLQAHKAEAIYARYSKMLGITAQEANKVKVSVEQMSKASGKAVRSGGGMQFFVQQVGFLASDAKYGLLGIGNNLSLLIGLLPQVAAEAKATGTTFARSFGRALWGVGGILVGIQLLVAFLPDIINFFKKYVLNVKEASKATKELTKDFDNLKKKVQEENEELVKLQDEFEKTIKKFISMSDNIDANGIDRDSPYYKAWLDLKEVIEETYGVVIDFTDPKWRQRLKELAGPLEQAVQKIIDARTELSIKKIKGDLTPVEIAEEELKLFIKTQKLLKVKEEDYIKSSKYRLLVAKIEKAKLDEAEKEKKRLLDERIKKNAEIEEEYEIRMADTRNRIRERAERVAREKREAALKKRRERQEGLNPDDYVPLDDYGDAEEEYDHEKDPEFKKLMAELKRRERAKFEALRDLRNVEGQSIEAQRKTEIDLFKSHLDNKLITQEEYERALAAIKRKYTLMEIKQAGERLQQLGGLLKGGGKIAIAGVLVEQGAALFDVVKGVQSRIKDIKNIPDPTGISQGVLIAKAVASGALEASVITAQASKSIQQIRQASKAAGGSAGDSSGGSRSPNFNIIGATGTSQIQQAVEAQTQATGDQRVVLVETELEMRQNDKKVAVEETSL